MAEKFLNEAGLALYDRRIRERLAQKADASAVPTRVGQLENDRDFITRQDVPEGAAASSSTPKMDGAPAPGAESAFARGDHVHPTDTSRLGTSGDGSQVTVSFNPAESRGAPRSGETLAVLLGRLAKNFADLGAMAYRDGVGREELDQAVRASLARADSALQSFTECDPTVPDWAKQAVKPAYTAAEVGAIPAEQADSFARKSDLTSVYRYRGSVATLAELPAQDNQVGDVYNVEATDMNYGWTGEAWDPLGQSFEVQAISSQEIDAITGG